MTTIELSPLPHTWLIDIDGTVFRHNGHKLGSDELLPGVADFWRTLPARDVVILMSARTQAEAEATLAALAAHGLRHDHAIFGLPPGERILINDAKPSGLATALAVNLGRDHGMTDIAVAINERL